MQNKISLIVPFYNEEKELIKIFKDICIFERNNNTINEYIFIDDCSKDASFKISKRLIKKVKKKIKKKFFLHQNKKNLGWAKSLKKGYMLSKNSHCLFIPGDGEARISQFLKKINFENDVIIFQRKKMTTRPMLRILISKTYKFLLYILFPIKLIDLNGLIIVKKNKIKKLSLFSNSFFISAEIIIKSFFYNFKIDKNNYFILSEKKKYKSTSLNFLQLYLVSKDLIKLFIYTFKLRFSNFKE